MSSPDWSRAVEAKTELVRWWESEAGMDWLWAWFHKAHHFDQQKAILLAEVYGNALKLAVPYYVTAEMVALVDAAARVMPPEPFLSSDPPISWGFVYLASPVLVKGPAINLPVHAFLWSSAEVDDATGRHTMVMLFSERDRIIEANPEFGDVRVRRLMCRLMPVIDVGFVPHQRIDTLVKGDIGTLVKAFWAISQQRLAHVANGHLNRATLRRLERADLPTEPVKVVTLRRQVNVTPTDVDVGNLVDWSHRWIVSGHWRNQWLPSVGAHRLQWISDYVKGPEDKPLVLKDTVFRVAR